MKKRRVPTRYMQVRAGWEAGLREGERRGLLRAAREIERWLRAHDEEIPHVPRPARAIEGCSACIPMEFQALSCRAEAKKLKERA